VFVDFRRMTIEIDFVVKLGGSAITNKDMHETLNVDAVTAAADVLAECYHLGQRFIVAHGAGKVFSVLHVDIIIIIIKRTFVVRLLLSKLRT